QRPRGGRGAWVVWLSALSPPRGWKCADEGDRGGNRAPPASEETPEEAAQYIATLSKELAALARRRGLGTLSQILDMAGMEAEQIAKGCSAARQMPPPRTSLHARIDEAVAQGPRLPRGKI